jgi:ankyrin repeat protein
MKMLRDDPRLSKAKDFTTGYTALHWAAKQGNLDLVKLLAGNYQVNVNVRSFGGYTPLHLGKIFPHLRSDKTVSRYARRRFSQKINK